MENKHTEAPASVTYSVVSPRGYPLLCTARENTFTKLLDTMDRIEEELSEKGYTAKVKKYGGAKADEPSESMYEEATPKQISLLKDRDLWKDGMTKSEASTVIGELLDK